MSSLDPQGSQSELEPVCHKKQQKISWPVTALWIRGPLKILNGIKLILNDVGNLFYWYTFSLELFRSFRGPLFCKPINGQELLFAVSYRKPALEDNQLIKLKYKRTRKQSSKYVDKRTSQLYLCQTQNDFHSHKI